MHDIEMTQPLNANHWMARECCLWLKAVNAQRCARFIDLTINKNHLPLRHVISASDYVWETEHSRGLSLRASRWWGENTNARGIAATGAKTVSVWIKVIGNSTLPQIYFSLNPNTVEASSSMFFSYDPSPWYGGVRSLRASMPNTAIIARMPYDLVDTGWHHVAFSMGSTIGTGVFYLDGVPLVMTVLGDGNFGLNLGTSPQFSIAKYVPTGVDGIYPLDGAIDDIRGYNRLLTNTEIKAIYDDSVAMRYEAINRKNNSGMIIGSGVLANIYVPSRSIIYGGGMGL